MSRNFSIETCKRQVQHTCNKVFLFIFLFFFSYTKLEFLRWEVIVSSFLNGSFWQTGHADVSWNYKQIVIADNVQKMDRCWIIFTLLCLTSYQTYTLFTNSVECLIWQTQPSKIREIEGLQQTCLSSGNHARKNRIDRNIFKIPN